MFHPCIGGRETSATHELMPQKPYIKTVFNKSAGQSAAAPNERLEALAKAKDHSNNHYFIDARRPEESIIKVKKGKNLEKFYNFLIFFI